jgi:hypothetical protein
MTVSTGPATARVSRARVSRARERSGAGTAAGHGAGPADNPAAAADLEAHARDEIRDRVVRPVRHAGRLCALPAGALAAGWLVRRWRRRAAPSGRRPGHAR